MRTSVNQRTRRAGLRINTLNPNNHEPSDTETMNERDNPERSAATLTSVDALTTRAKPAASANWPATGGLGWVSSFLVYKRRIP